MSKSNQKNLMVKILLVSILVGVILNLALPPLFNLFATKEQKTPTKGAHKLPFGDQLMHMFVHHAQVPLTSSLIILVIVGLSVLVPLLIFKVK